MSAPQPRDYPEWTRYSKGNPHGWRRIYCGHLLYAFDGTNGGDIHWTEPRTESRPEPVCHFTNTFEEAKSEAERWAEAQP